MRNANRKKRKKIGETPLPMPPSPIQNQHIHTVANNDEEIEAPEHFRNADIVCPSCGETGCMLVRQNITHWFSMDMIYEDGDTDTGYEEDTEWNDTTYSCGVCGDDAYGFEVWDATFDVWRTLNT